MNGSTLTLSLVGALALGAAAGRRGSRATGLTSTPAFRRWFGESKVVDAEGRPLVVYHGGKSGTPSAPAFLTPDREGAQWYAGERGGGVHAAFVAMKNPLDIDSKGGFDTLLRAANAAGVEATFKNGVFDAPGLIGVERASTHNPLDLLYSPEVRAELLREGYDGVRGFDVLENSEIPVFVTISDGVIAPADSRILYSRAPGNQTDTPAFRRWFGESKVVDAEGRPLVVYHGTTAPRFDAFVPRGTPRKEHLAFGFHFAADEELAARYAFDPAVRRKATKGGEPRVIEAWLSIQNPFDATGWVEHDSEGYALLKEIAGRKLRPFMVQDGVYLYRVGAMLDHAPPERVEQILRAHGYDGVRYTLQLGFSTTHRRTITGEGVGWIAFDPTQIKSATGNRGTFDPADPRISFNRGVR
jgi:hypothetical protein